MAAGFPSRSDDQVIPELPPLVAAAPAPISTLWVKTLERVTVMDLAEQVELEPIRLAQLNGLSLLDSFEADQWVSLPDTLESSLFLVTSLDSESTRSTKPESFADDNLAAKMSRLGKLVSQSTLPPVHARQTLAIVPGMSGGLSWPELPDFGQLRRPQLSGYLWPAKGTLTSGYGWRWGRMHRGIDVANSVGTPIIAAADGKVVFSGWSSGGYGYLVELAHSDGSKTRYAHNSALLVKKGQQVFQGTAIARMGSTGRSTGPHLHFEIIKPGLGAVNPVRHLTRRG
jgi:murein DD-endopeptidase MepM/ murein hydrolase activator NlpD